MSPSEYSELTKAKERAASLHRLRKLRFRERIADAIQANPEWAYARTQEALNKETAVWQQWSRAAWKTLLASKNPIEIAEAAIKQAEIEAIEKQLIETEEFVDDVELARKKKTPVQYQEYIKK